LVYLTTFYQCRWLYSIESVGSCGWWVAKNIGGSNDTLFESIIPEEVTENSRNLSHISRSAEPLKPEAEVW